MEHALRARQPASTPVVAVCGALARAGSRATANDIVGTGARHRYGQSFPRSFTLALKPGNPLFNVRMTQDMYLSRRPDDG
jgi:hypothetical protein